MFMCIWGPKRHEEGVRAAGAEAIARCEPIDTASLLGIQHRSTGRGAGAILPFPSCGLDINWSLGNESYPLFHCCEFCCYEKVSITGYSSAVSLYKNGFSLSNVYVSLKSPSTSTGNTPVLL